PVHVAMPVEQAGMMRMIGRLPGQLSGRKRAVDNLAGGGTYRVKIGPIQVLAADVEDTERLAVDFDGDLFRPRRELDLCPGRRRRAEQQNGEERRHAGGSRTHGLLLLSLSTVALSTCIDKRITTKHI